MARHWHILPALGLPSPPPVDRLPACLTAPSVEVLEEEEEEEEEDEGAAIHGSNESLHGLVLSRDSSSGTEGSSGSLPGFGDSSSSERGSNGSLPDLVD